MGVGRELTDQTGGCRSSYLQSEEVMHWVCS